MTQPDHSAALGQVPEDQHCPYCGKVFTPVWRTSQGGWWAFPVHQVNGVACLGVLLDITAKIPGEL